MDEIIKKIKLVIDEISNERPYKVPGNTDTYNQYNEAWQDCCDRILGQIQDTMSTQQPKLTIGDKIRESNENLAKEFARILNNGNTRIEIFDMRGWGYVKWLNYFNQPSTDAT